jgi:hypothetical protein
LYAIENKDYIFLFSKYLSGKLFGFLYNCEVFKDNHYNKYAPKVDYDFLLEMFSKKDKNKIARAQNQKSSAIISNSIKPFLISMLQSKIKRER